MNKITTISSMVALAIGLGACQSGKNDISLQPVVAYKSEQVSKQITNIPDWYLNMPTDEEAIYSSGSAKAPDLQLAVDIAIMNAKTVLADRINGKLSSMTKSFIAKIGSSDLDTSVLSEIERYLRMWLQNIEHMYYFNTVMKKPSRLWWIEWEKIEWSIQD